MVAVREWTSVIKQKLAKIGRSGRLPKGADPNKKFDEIAREVADLKDAVSLLVRHVRQGPDWETSFVVNSGQITDPENLLTLPHNLGYVPNRFVISRISSPDPSSSIPNNWGQLRLFQATASSVTFQVDTASMNQETIYILHPYRSVFVGLDNA